jgi:hypothetical protein
MRLRDPLRLIREDVCVEFIPSLLPDSGTRVTTHRFDETIGGRVYQIEVTPVSNRWRAQLCRTPGLPTAMMPFYGKTPDEAARQLARWLTLAHGRHATAAGAPAPEAVKIQPNFTP